MKVFKKLSQLPKFKNPVITIGSFDGIHLGHQEIIQRVNGLARDIIGESIVITFHPHPRLVIYPKDNSLQLLTSIEEKTELFRECGVDNLVIAPFTVGFSQMSADEYIENFLVEKFNPRYIVIGHDHRFGLNRQGNIDFLKWHSDKYNYEVIEIERQEIDAIAVSSTKIRKAINSKEIAAANDLLGHRFSLTGTVVKGLQIGSTLGFPTANLRVADKHKLIPPNGIYAVTVMHQDQTYGGMLYIGDRPSVHKINDLTIEINIFDFNRSIYGEKLKVELVDFIRNDITFSNLDKLKAQLAKDKQASLEILKKKSYAKITPDKTSKAAIVILNYNGKEHLEKFLPSVINTIKDTTDLYVADNHSTDDSVNWLRQNHPSITLIELNKNHGFAGGYNQCLEQVDADFYVLLNSDVEVTPGWLDPILRLLNSDQTIAACQPKIRAYTEKEYFEYAGAAGGWIDYLGYPFCMGRIFDVNEKDTGQYDGVRPIFWASGATMVIRADLFHKVGGFDADYFAHSEEIDLCWRLQRAGYKIMTCTDSVVYHLGGGTLNYQSDFKIYLNFRNSLFTLLKNEPVLKLLWLIPTRLILDGVAALLFLSEKKYTNIQAILKAHRSFYRNFFKILKQRRINKKIINEIKIKKRSQLQGRYKGSIVLQYYILGKKRFRDIGAMSDEQ